MPENNNSAFSNNHIIKPMGVPYYLFGPHSTTRYVEVIFARAVIMGTLL